MSEQLDWQRSPLSLSQWVQIVVIIVTFPIWCIPAVIFWLVCTVWEWIGYMSRPERG